MIIALRVDLYIYFFVIPFELLMNYLIYLDEGGVNVFLLYFRLA